MTRSILVLNHATTPLEALNLDNCSIADDSRIEKILENLKQKLTTKRIPYCCFILVCGIKEQGLPFSIGQVEFAVFDDLHVDRFKEIVEKHKIQSDVK
jgi:hypothetical protein